ncbi:tripartite tricarboxylate transporter substrate binding protein [Schaalia sp. ZJ405]|uniref:tripartite tricarboxylate transporter substrate binding protein n=1 Tax=Schaalia sp. ZJ405 TaxID=2709403 RepID=UPI0013ECDE78|nr:tripartite tricarboxylate transporter substrate binding protein [Schaalia sp. ZJ405]QPK81637.1 tripartite tricarboxylate transporter substrate binding protein [Schaalia sp. ZJ405]
MKNRIFAAVAAGTLAVLALSGCVTQTNNGSSGQSNASAAESDYPTKPIDLVVAWSAGGGTDVQARALVQNAKEYLGTNINVVNKPGSSGAIGWGEIAHSTKPDGYTLTVVSPEIGFMQEQGLYDFGLEDFTLITMFNEDPMALAVKADAPWANLEEFLADAKANPGKITIGNAGPGLAWDLATTAIEEAAGVEFTHVPYDGASTAVQAILGGTLDAMTYSIGEVRSQVEAGEMRVLAIASEEQLKALPNIPTFKSEGHDIVTGTFRGIAGPAGMDPAMVKTLNEAFVKMAKDKGFIDVMESNSFGIKVLETDEFQTFFGNAKELYSELIEAQKK